MTAHPDHSSLTGTITDLLRERYVIEHDVDALVAALEGAPDDLTDLDPASVARRLTDLLQQAGHDRHLRVVHRPPGTAPADGDEDTRWAAEARQNAGGVRQVRQLGGGTGLLEIGPYLSEAHLAAPHLAAAFTLLGGSRALVIDVRRGHGGTPDAVALLCGYLLGPEPVHLQDVVERSGPGRQFWSVPTATAVTGPVAVLTSSTTFSGCEELAYDLQALGRATVVGETTAGGAHPVTAVRLTEQLQLQLPVARSVNAVTGTNWERVGVRPDLPCPAAEAPARARALLTA